VSGSPEITIELCGADRVELVRELWLALHHHHQRVASFQPLVADDEQSWASRRELYLGRLVDESGFLAVTFDGSSRLVVGYAAVMIETGPDDTFPLGERYAELYSLAVAEQSRGRGIGTQLLDFVDRELDARGISALKVGVMLGNEDALRFYERRGLRAAELVLYRADAEGRGPGARRSRPGSAGSR
jgi:ribosomal protein S18 acetylase RimI-like enzyme